MAAKVWIVTADLFGQPDFTPDRPVPGRVVTIAEVAIEQAIDKLLSYEVPGGMAKLIRPGQRVKVPLGRNNRPVQGYVVRVVQGGGDKLKAVTEITDDRTLIDERLMSLARWMSGYYVTPMGTVLEAVVPSAVRKQIGLGSITMVRVIAAREKLQQLSETIKAPKRRALIARLLQLQENEEIEIVRLAGEADTTLPTVRKLRAAGIIEIDTRPDMAGEVGGEEDHVLPGEKFVDDFQPPTMTADQARAVEQIGQRLGAGFSVSLLMGVTGSGKTEVYLRLIDRVLREGRQAIVLVPEIALTPQTVRRFTQRFRRVAVLHSGLTATQRHKFWQRVSSGMADVVIGARSAVFAPVPKLGLVVVDEEHESSYKQDQAPRYHARDVSIKRAQLEGAPVLLGSATPALEMYYRAMVAEKQAAAGKERGSFFLHKLPSRVSNRPMPAVEIIDMKQDRQMRKGLHLISFRLEKALKDTLAAGQQAILLLNRRGHSSFVYCPSCKYEHRCQYCSVTMTYHRAIGANEQSTTLAKSVHTGNMICHYCLAAGKLPDKCPACGKRLSLIGMGTQRVEEELQRKFPDLTYTRVDSDTMRTSSDYERALAAFSSGETKVLLGTQMIAKGLDFPSVTLVGVISADTALSLPDYRAAERTFQLLTQVAGRAGRGEQPGRVIVQTFQPEDPVIALAAKQDFERFALSELSHRKETHNPPYTRQARLVLKDTDDQRLAIATAQVHADIVQLMEAEPGVYGELILSPPAPCVIDRIAGYHRQQIIMRAPTAGLLQRLLQGLRGAHKLMSADRLAVDVDPVSQL